MPERILVLDDKGTRTELLHLGPDENVNIVEEGDNTVISVGATVVQVLAEGRDVDLDNDDTPGPMGTVVDTIPADSLILAPEDITVEQLKDLARDKDLAVGGTKDELIARLNEDALENGI
jgi:uncharacterized FAD-dependent dehydrogenase